MIFQVSFSPLRPLSLSSCSSNLHSYARPVPWSVSHPGGRCRVALPLAVLVFNPPQPQTSWNVSSSCRKAASVAPRCRPGPLCPTTKMWDGTSPGHPQPGTASSKVGRQAQGSLFITAREEESQTVKLGLLNCFWLWFPPARHPGALPWRLENEVAGCG